MQGDTLITPPSRCAALGRVESELVSLPEQALLSHGRRLRMVHKCARLACWRRMSSSVESPVVIVVQQDTVAMVRCFILLSA